MSSSRYHHHHQSHSHPSSASRLDSELEAALDYLGFNPLEGVAFDLNPAFVPPTDLLRRTEATLSRPLPGEAALAEGRYRYDGRVERQVIEQLRLMDEAKRRREEEEERQMALYEQEQEKIRKEKEEADKKKAREEQEAKDKKEEEDRKRKQREQEEEEERKKKNDEAEASVNAAAAATEKPATAPPPGAAPVPMPPPGGLPAVAPVATQQNGPSAGLQLQQQLPVSALQALSIRSPPQQAATAGVVAPPSRPVVPPPQTGGVRLPPMPLGPRPNQGATLPVTQAQHVAKPSASPAGAAKIDYSEFEGPSDPFDSLELKTINDFQALASVLQTSTASQQQQGSFHMTQQVNPAYTNVQQLRAQQPQQQQMQQQQMQPRPRTAAQQLAQQHQHQFLRTQSQDAFKYPAFSPPVYSGYGHQQVPSFFPQQAAAAGRPPAPPQGVPVAAAATQLPPNYHPVNNPYGIVTRQDSGSSLKASKSFGDIASEIKKEDEAMERLKAGVAAGAKHSSVTPPPRAGGVVARGLEDWVPWPDPSGQPTPAAKPATTPEPDSTAVLTTEKQRRTCAQVSEMGFPLSRAVRACQAMGTADDDGGVQRIVHFCLLVDRLTSEELGGGAEAEAEAEHVLLLKSCDEESSRRHLRSFAKLKVLGFDSRAVHDALVACDSDHDKALERLLK